MLPGSINAPPMTRAVYGIPVKWPVTWLWADPAVQVHASLFITVRHCV